MKIRMGYVAISLKLPNVTSSSNVTFSHYNKIIGDEKKLNKLKQVTLSNLDDLYKILKYNIDNEIYFYRITSKLVPLATHPQVNWNYRKMFKIDFNRIGDLIKENNLRVDTHPDQFNVINSEREDVVENTKITLMHHVHLFEDLNYKDGKMIIHVGSGAGGKEKAIKRFIKNFKKYPDEITSRLIIENDDKVFTAKDVLKLCKELDTPMVLDVHHHNCNNEGENLEDLIPDIFETWNNETLPPKIHFSSPRNGENDRKHADYINIKDFSYFLETAKIIDEDFDIMLEAKKKDLTLYKLVDDLKTYNENINWINKSTFEM